MRLHRQFRHLQPVFFSGLFDDPVLLVRIRPTGRSLIFDCGQIHHLAKRVLKSVDIVFVSHGHMDHFMGIDTLIRNVHVSPHTIEIYGPPGTGAKVEHKFSSYDWNLTECCWASFRAREFVGGKIRSYLLPGPDGFRCRYEGEHLAEGLVIYADEFLQVEAALFDHKIPSAVFKITEKPAFSIDERKLEDSGFVKGEWLRALKKRMHQPRSTDRVVTLRRLPSGEIAEVPVDDIRSLYDSIRQETNPATIGYMTDIGFENNADGIIEYLQGVTLLVCECSFLADHRDKARASHHLCTIDLNYLVDRLRPQYVLPMHLSKTYAGQSSRLYEELDFPEGVSTLFLPDRVTPRPLLMEEGIELLRPKRRMLT